MCDPIDGSPPGSPVPGILQARTLEWVAISFSNAWKWKAKVKSLSCVWLFATPWTAAYQAPPSMGFSRQEYWSRLPSPSPSNYLGNSYPPHLCTKSEIKTLITSSPVKARCCWSWLLLALEPLSPKHNSSRSTTIPIPKSIIASPVLFKEPANICRMLAVSEHMSQWDSYHFHHSVGETETESPFFFFSLFY